MSDQKSGMVALKMQKCSPAYSELQDASVLTILCKRLGFDPL